MAETQINQTQLALGSETAVDLLSMQNGWKKEMITALNNKIPGYASSADTMATLVNKFAALTGNTPDNVYGVFKSAGYGQVRAHNFTMPKTTNSTWEITVCKKHLHDGVLSNDVYANDGIHFRAEVGSGKVGLIVPVYREDDPTTREYLEFESNEGVYSFVVGTKYWFKFGYNDEEEYYVKVSADGTNYSTIYEVSSARKTECNDYLWFYVGGGLADGTSDALYLTECSVVVDGNTVFDGGGNITISNAQGANADVTWQDGAVYLLQAIQL